MISKYDLEEAYRIRGQATDKERGIEDAIFSKTAHHSDKEIDELLRDYKQAKDERAAASINAARLYMLATPAVREAAEWRKYTPGHEKDPGRGEQSIL
jgi:5'-deoxynucleotidase YfbR-like HD superfamily hydrolase